MVVVEDLRKEYRLGDVVVPVLKGVSFGIGRGELVSIMGPSGSGKSTLMNLIGCLDTPTAGTYALDGQPVAALSDDRLSEVRARHIGFVFQSFCLIKYLTVLENVLLPTEYLDMDEHEAEGMARTWLERVGLGHRLTHLPHQLSGGERQRVAIARALVKEPKLILADEPTGNLDCRAESEVIAAFREVNEEMGVTIVVVTHSDEVAARTPRCIRLRDGVLV